MYILVVLFLVLVLLTLVAWFILLLIQTPDVGYLVTENPEETAFMRFRDRQYRYGANQKKHKWVELSKISPYLIHSVIIAEDPNFLIHQGFYWEEIWIALLSNLREKRIVKGGSSISQQLAKNLFLTPSRSVLRKIRESLITIKIERELTKARILELYLNLIEWGENIYGAEEASRFYFNKSASELRLSEAIRLSVTVPNPRIFSPLDNSNENLKTTQKRVLRGLWERGWISRPKFMQTYMELHKFFESVSSPQELVPSTDVPARFATPGFWIAKIKDADERIMSGDEIDVFNRRAGLICGGIDILTLPEFVSFKEIKEKILEVSGLEPYLSSSLDIFSDMKEVELLTSLYFSEGYPRFDRDNEPLKADLYLNILKNMNLDNLNEDKKMRFAFAVRRTDILAWPYDEIVMNKKFDYEFNRLQQSSLNFAEPAAVIHQSRNGEWAFMRTRFVDGWVKSSDLAFTDREQAAGYPGEKFLVVVCPGSATESGVEVQMGVRLCLIGKNSGYYEIDIPARDENGASFITRDNISEEFVNEGYIHYTKANAVKTAFKLLGTPYGWGGSNGGVDCSSYMQNIFSVFGIILPRNSSVQTSAGTIISRFSAPRKSLETKRAQIETWEPGITLLKFPGHIMLYLGEEDGQYYAIHSVWGISEENNKICHINKVSVTDLYLGQGSVNGSLLERISEVASIYLGPSGLRSLIRDFLHALSKHPWRRVVILGTAVVFAIAVALVIIIL